MIDATRIVLMVGVGSDGSIQRTGLWANDKDLAATHNPAPTADAVGTLTARAAQPRRLRMLHTAATCLTSCSAPVAVPPTAGTRSSMLTFGAAPCVAHGRRAPSVCLVDGSIDLHIENLA